MDGQLPSEDGHHPTKAWSPPEGSLIENWNSVFRLNSQLWAGAMYGHRPSLGSYDPHYPKPKDGHPTKGSILQTQNLKLRLNSQN